MRSAEKRGEIAQQSRNKDGSISLRLESSPPHSTLKKTHLANRQTSYYVTCVRSVSQRAGVITPALTKRAKALVR